MFKYPDSPKGNNFSSFSLRLQFNWLTAISMRSSSRLVMLFSTFLGWLEVEKEMSCTLSADLNDEICR